MSQGLGISIVGISAVNLSEWSKVLYGLIISSVLGIIFGYVIIKLIILIFKKFERSGTNPFFRYAQIFSGAMMAFLHGAQDGQKFIGVFMLGTFLARGESVPEVFDIPVPILILFAIVMGVRHFNWWL